MFAFLCLAVPPVAEKNAKKAIGLLFRGNLFGDLTHIHWPKQSLVSATGALAMPPTFESHLSSACSLFQACHSPVLLACSAFRLGTHRFTHRFTHPSRAILPDIANSIKEVFHIFTRGIRLRKNFALAYNEDIRCNTKLKLSTEAVDTS